jgi:hypothetical protein
MSGCPYAGQKSGHPFSLEAEAKNEKSLRGKYPKKIQGKLFFSSPKQKGL